MTQQIKHNRISCKGMLFAAGSRQEQIKREVNEMFKRWEEGLPPRNEYERKWRVAMDKANDEINEEVMEDDLYGNRAYYAAGKRKVVHLKKHVEGYVTSPTAALKAASRSLKKYGNDSTMLLGFYNGTDIFIKKNGKVRSTTPEEYKFIGNNVYNLR